MSDLDRQRLLAMGAMQQSTPIAAPQQTATWFNPAVQALGLTAQEQFLYQHHLNNLWSLNGGAPYAQPAGGMSTIYQMVTQGPDGRFYNVPRLWGGQIVSPQDAEQRAAAVGWDRWPAYGSPDAADQRYGLMHPYFDRDLGEWQKLHPPAPAPAMTPAAPAAPTAPAERVPSGAPKVGG
jgi:hypothetical protein